MPRDRNAALAAWAKRGRGKGDGNTVEAADIIAPGAGTGTRRGMVEGFRAMRNMKNAIASADAKRVTPMSARTAGRAAKAAEAAAAKQARAPNKNHPLYKTYERETDPTSRRRGTCRPHSPDSGDHDALLCFGHD